MWPATSVVAKAYVDQLNRSKSIDAERSKAIVAALDKLDRFRSSKDNGAAATLDQLTSLASQVEKDAAAATGRDQMRLNALAETLKGRVARLRG